MDKKYFIAQKYLSSNETRLVGTRRWWVKNNGAHRVRKELRSSRMFRVVGIKPRPIVSDGKFGDMDELLPP